MIDNLTCFKAYDIRGKIGVNLNEEICYRIGRACASVLGLKRVIIGFDARETSPLLTEAISKGLITEGVDIYNIGMCGTEEMYWATSEFQACAGIEVTASHNPIDYNGLKIVKSGSRPLDTETEFQKIKMVAEKNIFIKKKVDGQSYDISRNARQAYIEKIFNFVEVDKFVPLKIVINSGNGAAGPTVDAIEKHLLRMTNALTVERLYHDPDHTFPNGIPNPILLENHSPTRNKILQTGANLGVAFDGDFDRCFLFDENGDFVPSEYIVGLLASVFLKKEPGATIIHDPRIIWNTQDIVTKAGGTAVQSKTGHVFLKHAIRDKKAIYGGEISAHHYFRDFACCDSGMIPWLLIVELMSNTGQSLSSLVKERMTSFPSSGEINFIIPDPELSMKKILDHYRNGAISIEFVDGLSCDFKDWRFNIRLSNTEPLLRLNIESRGNKKLIGEKLKEIRDILLL